MVFGFRLLRGCDPGTSLALLKGHGVHKSYNPGSNRLSRMYRRATCEVFVNDPIRESCASTCDQPAAVRKACMRERECKEDREIAAIKSIVVDQSPVLCAHSRPPRYGTDDL